MGLYTNVQLENAQVSFGPGSSAKGLILNALRDVQPATFYTTVSIPTGNIQDGPLVDLTLLGSLWMSATLLSIKAIRSRIYSSSDG